LRTANQLNFRLAHAAARDAVNAAFDLEALTTALQRQGLEVETLETRAKDRRTYLLRPDLGRELDPVSKGKLRSARARSGERNLAVILSDGLSAQATACHAAAVVVPLEEKLRAAGWTLFPILVVPFARVKVQDEIGELLGARHTLILLGERPGLGAPDSLGAYFTYAPERTRTDADRNCVSNIRDEGLPPPAAARLLADLLCESARQKCSGVKLQGRTGNQALP